MGVSEVYADGVLQKLSMLSWRVGAVLSLNYGLLLGGRFVSERDDCLVVASDNRLHHAHYAKTQINPFIPFYRTPICDRQTETVTDTGP